MLSASPGSLWSRCPAGMKQGTQRARWALLPAPLLWEPSWQSPPGQQEPAPPRLPSLRAQLYLCCCACPSCSSAPPAAGTAGPTLPFVPSLAGLEGQGLAAGPPAGPFVVFTLPIVPQRAAYIGPCPGQVKYGCPGAGALCLCHGATGGAQRTCLGCRVPRNQPLAAGEAWAVSLQPCSLLRDSHGHRWHRAVLCAPLPAGQKG